MNETPAPPLHRRILDTFVAPRRLFATFGPDAPFLDVLLITTGAAVLAATMLPDELFLAQVENPVDRLGRPVVVTSPPETIVHYGRLMAMLSALAGHPILAFALAGLITLIFSVLGGGTVTYRRYLAVVCHALLIPALGTLLLLGANAVSKETVSLNFALLAPGLAPGTLGLRLLAGIDPFMVWMLVVCGAGVAALDRRRSWAGASAVLLVLYLLLDLSTALFIA